MTEERLSGSHETDPAEIGPEPSPGDLEQSVEQTGSPFGRIGAGVARFGLYSTAVLLVGGLAALSMFPQLAAQATFIPDSVLNLAGVDAARQYPYQGRRKPSCGSACAAAAKTCQQAKSTCAATCNLEPISEPSAPATGIAYEGQPPEPEMHSPEAL